MSAKNSPSVGIMRCVSYPDCNDRLGGWVFATLMCPLEVSEYAP